MADFKQHKIVLYDTECVLCNASVRFIIRHDSKNQYMFSSLKAETVKQILGTYTRYLIDPNTVILIDEGKFFSKSTAALKIAQQLNGIWPLFYIFIVIPKPIRDFIYDLVAKNRYRLFDKTDNCLIPDSKDLEKLIR